MSCYRVPIGRKCPGSEHAASDPVPLDARQTHVRAHTTGHLSDKAYMSMQRTVNEERNHQAVHSMRTPKEEPGSFAVTPGTLLSSLITRHGGYQRCAADLGFNGDHLWHITSWHRQHNISIVPTLSTIAANN